MSIGELAARTGVNVQTILYYERRRLLPRPPRTPAGYRSYTDADAAQVHFIRQTQQLGFTLNQIAALMPHHGSPRNPGRLSRRTPDDDLALYRLVSEHLCRVDAQIAALQQIRDALRASLDESRSRLTTCPAQEARVSESRGSKSIDPPSGGKRNRSPRAGGVRNQRATIDVYRSISM